MINSKSNKSILMILMAANLAPILGDMNYKFLNFGDVLVITFIISASIYLFKNNYSMNWMILKKPLIILTYIFAHLILFLLVSKDFGKIKGIYYAGKLTLYICFVIAVVTFVKHTKTVRLFFTITKYVVLFVGAMGIIISLLLYFGNTKIPYLIWSFTRQDVSSYTFRNSSIIRMRSLFSEPSYLGIYINSILAILVTSKGKLDDKVTIITIALISFLSFSISSIVTTVMMLIYYLISTVDVKSISNRKILFVWILAPIVLLVVFRVQIYETVIIRFIQILNGKDTSTLARIFKSWSHINLGNFLQGSGLGTSPAIWNNFAYFIGDLGLLFVVLAVYLYRDAVKKHIPLFFFFTLLNFETGRYLNISFWYFIALISIVISVNEKYIGSNELSSLDEGIDN